MDIPIFEIIESLAASHKLTAEEIMQILEKCFKEAWEANYGEGYDITLEVVDKKLVLFRHVEIVETVEDVKTQIKGENIGSIVKEKLSIESLPRNIIMNIYDEIQKEVKEIHRQREFDLYKDEEGKLFKLSVKRVMGRTVVLNVANLYEGVIPQQYFNQRERFMPGEQIYCRLAEVNPNSIDHQLIFERRTKEFIELLFAEFVPEVASGAVYIKSVAREAGSLCKVMVASDNNINAVGACLGMKGKRRLEIAKELKGEKLDIIGYNANIIYQVKECFKSKNIIVEQVNVIDDDNIEVVIPDDKIPEAIGRRGQNIYLTKKLLGKQINIISASDFKVKDKDRIEKEAEFLIEFGLSKEDSIYILENYQNIEDALYDSYLGDESKDKIKSYIDAQNEEDRNVFVENGGDANFFLSISGIPNYVYFKLLEYGIASSEDLHKIESAEELHQGTGLDIDICIMLMEN